MNLVVDDPFDLQEAMPRPHETDLIVTLGGTGMSDRDVVIDSMAELGVELRFQGIAARPGHYTSFGMMEETPVLCLPGGPSAADMMFKLLGRRMVAALTGMTARDLTVHSAVLAQDIPAKDGDFDRLMRVKFESSKEGIKAVPLSGLSLHKDIAESEGIIRIPASESRAAGDRVEVWITR
jgi:molybdopterin molybdotransferase